MRCLQAILVFHILRTVVSQGSSNTRCSGAIKPDRGLQLLNLRVVKSHDFGEGRGVGEEGEEEGET